MRLMIVDDHPIVLGGLQRLLATAPGFEVVGACRSGTEALEQIPQLAPDLVLLDLRLPDLTGLEVFTRLRAGHAPVSVVFFTAMAAAHEIQAARALGAAGFLFKDIAPSDLILELHRAAAGLQPFPDTAADGQASAAMVRLTPRELDVARCVADGLRNREIAERLGIAEGTVKLHLNKLFDKLGVDSRLKLMLAFKDAAGFLTAPGPDRPSVL